MKRKDINGFSLNFFDYSLEFVRIKNKLKVISLWKNEHLIKRFLDLK